MVSRVIAVVNLFSVLSICVIPSKGLPQRKEISQGKDRCDHCEDLIKADASALDYPRSPKGTSEPDIPLKNVSETTTATEDAKKSEGLVPEDCKFNCTKSSETPDETVGEILRSAPAEEREELRQIRLQGTSAEKPLAADYDQKMESKGERGDINGFNSAPLGGRRALTNLENQTSDADKPPTAVGPSSAVETSSPTAAASSSVVETPSPTAAAPSSVVETPSPTAAASSSTEATAITGIKPSGTETAVPLSTTSPVTTMTKPPENGTANEKDLADMDIMDFLENLIELLEDISVDENLAEEIEIMEQDLTNFFRCLEEYVDTGMTRPLKEVCGDFVNEDFFRDFMEYINPPIESDYNEEDIYGDPEGIPQSFGSDLRRRGTRRAEKDAYNASESSTSGRKGLSPYWDSIDAFRRYQRSRRFHRTI